jgi:uncharacterized protein (DUF2141 family)
MLKQLIKIWRSNNGTILFAFGVVAAIFMSILWRFDMIPDIGPALRASTMIIGARQTKHVPSIVVVSITSANYPDADVIMQIFSAPDLASESTTPFETRTTTLRDGLAEFVILDLPRGTFAGFAFIDANGNGQIDLAEDGSPAEPMGYATAKQQDESKALGNGVFEVTGEPAFVKIHLLKPTAPSSRSRENIKK